MFWIRINLIHLPVLQTFVFHPLDSNGDKQEKFLKNMTISHTSVMRDAAAQEIIEIAASDKLHHIIEQPFDSFRCL